MQVTFRNNKLEKCYTNHKLATRAWGDVVGRRFVQRVDMIQASADFDTLRQLPGLNCHPLKGDRKGQHALSLTGFWRLIFTLIGRKLEIVMIEEVSKHYDD